ncbi:MAG: hypothetical protein JXA00_01035 [Candidatus Thermoplasmatota archaeon]|nr:hypothetical protein [Candidatus Thermoplasmatota archaeon]
MVRGIATDEKKYKHVRQDDDQWLSKDVQEIRKTAELYIEGLRPVDDQETPGRRAQRSAHDMRIIHMLVILLGIFGTMTLLAGLYFLIKGNGIIGVSATSIGAVFMMALLLYEKYNS